MSIGTQVYHGGGGRRRREQFLSVWTFGLESYTSLTLLLFFFCYLNNGSIQNMLSRNARGVQLIE